MRTCYTDILFPKIDWCSDKVIIRTNSKLNLLELANENAEFYHLYVALLKHDFMLYQHVDEHSFFVKRKLIGQLYNETNIRQYANLFYTLEKPNKYRLGGEMNLVIVFSSMPIQDDGISPEIKKRCFFKNYPSLCRYLLPNTYVVRLMDCNLTYGSYYLNTSNYTNYERQIQNFIQDISIELKIRREKIILFGISKGGTGALYHSIEGNYHSVSVDPLFSLTKYFKEGDSHFTQSFLPEKLMFFFKNIDQVYRERKSKIIIGVPTVRENYQEYIQLKCPNLKVVNVFDDYINQHGQIGSQTMVEQITYLNGMLLEEI